MVFRPDPKPEPRKKKSKKPLPRKEPTGELEVFKTIGVNRMSYSQISQEPIHNLGVSNFAHIINKKKYPKFILNPNNIAILTVEEHRLWDNERSKIDFEVPGWALLRSLEETLIDLYTERHGLVK